MESVLKADIFFVITGAAVVIITGMLAILMVYAIKILLDIKYITGKVRRGVEVVSEDAGRIRSTVQGMTEKITNILSVFDFAAHVKRSKGRRSKKEE